MGEKEKHDEQRLNVRLSCGHQFHQQCVEAWVVKKQSDRNSFSEIFMASAGGASQVATCPMCRQEVSWSPFAVRDILRVQGYTLCGLGVLSLFFPVMALIRATLEVGWFISFFGFNYYSKYESALASLIFAVIILKVQIPASITGLVPGSLSLSLNKYAYACYILKWYGVWGDILGWWEEYSYEDDEKMYLSYSSHLIPCLDGTPVRFGSRIARAIAFFYWNPSWLSGGVLIAWLTRYWLSMCSQHVARIVLLLV